MNALFHLWSQAPGTFSSARVLLVTLIAAATFLFVRGALSIAGWASSPARRRLESLGGTDNGNVGREWPAAIAAAVQPFARFVMPTSGKERGSMQEKFIKAGLYSPTALAVFYGIKTVLALLLLGMWIFVANLLPRLSANQVIFFGALAAFIGLTIPNIVLNRMLERRQNALRRAFPDALDLLVVCVESGLGLAAALQRVALELRVSYPELAGELERVNAEMQAGMEREQALRNLATRTGLDDVRALVGLLVQTMRFGTSVADTLRVYSEEFRDKRLQTAEEIAAKLGTKMIFPMVLCFFPSFFLIAVGPAILRLVQVFGHGSS